MAMAARSEQNTPFDGILTTSEHHTRGSLRRPFFVQWWEQALVARNYAGALWRTVVVGCMKPANWEYCWPPDWLVPYLDDLWRYYTEAPYAAERKILADED